MTALEAKKCAHPNCSCQVQSGEKYCSAQCEAAGDTPDIDCKCEHPGCAGRID
jgi:metallothionein